jgi:hypothetical protein
MGYGPTSVNTVFIGSSSYRYNTRKKLCEFTTPLQVPILPIKATVPKSEVV